MLFYSFVVLFLVLKFVISNDPAMRDRLEAVCANAQRQIDQLMGQLGDLAEMALSDPSNDELRQRLEGVFGEAEAVSAKLVAACGQDLLIQSNRLLADKLAGTPFFSFFHPLFHLLNDCDQS